MARLPITAIVIVAMVLVVLGVLVLFFVGTGGRQQQEAQARAAFTQACVPICQRVSAGEDLLAVSLGKTALERDFPQFLDACEQLSGTRIAGPCLSACGCSAKADPCKSLCETSNAFIDSRSFYETLRTNPRSFYYKFGCPPFDQADC